MPTAMSAFPWWRSLPASTDPKGSDLCNNCGIVRWRHEQSPMVAGCSKGAVRDAPYRVAGLPDGYVYDEVKPQFQDPYGIDFTFISPSYLRLHNITLD